MSNPLDQAYRLAAVRGLYRIAARIRNIEVGPSPMKTAHTDGSKIVIDPSFLEKLDMEEALFIAAHEYYHIIYDHIRRGREAEYNGMIYNIACDAIINDHLVSGLGLRRPSKGIGGIFRDDELFDGMPANCDTSDAIYAWLIDNAKKPQAGDDMGDMIDGAKDADANPGDAVKNHADRVAEAQSAKETGKGRTKEIMKATGRDLTTDNGENWIDLLTAMRIESGRLVRREIIHNYSRPCRREEPTGIVLPAARHIVAMPRVDVYIDVSGSMGGHPLTIFNGLRSILSSLSIYRPRFYAFDTDIKKIDIRASNFSMGGGTDIKKVLKKIADEKSDLALLITDCQDSVQISDFRKNVVVVSDNSAMADFFTTDWKKVKATNQRRIYKNA